jgi:peptidoglycan/LPS O-acetylase OafA/YrhL
MGFFFLIAGYFVPVSLDRKGSQSFIADRLLRLGVPLLVYLFVLQPLTIALAQANSWPQIFAIWIIATWNGQFGSGPTWFLQALLSFSLVYVLWRLVARSVGRMDRPLPNHLAFFVSALLVGAGALSLRLVFPVDSPISNLELGYFASYVFLFAIGVAGAHSKWLERVPPQLAPPWLIISAVSLGVMSTSMQFGRRDDYVGGWTTHAAVYAFFEPFFAWGVILGLLRLFQSYLNIPSRLGRYLAARAYGVYLIHAPLLVIVSRSIAHWDAPIAVKFAVAGALCCAASVAATSLILLVPGARRIL